MTIASRFNHGFSPRRVESSKLHFSHHDSPRRPPPLSATSLSPSPTAIRSVGPASIYPREQSKPCRKEGPSFCISSYCSTNISPSFCLFFFFPGFADRSLVACLIAVYFDGRKIWI
ncbi:uncharacterized protein LOC130988675 isoform X2 [Salvia miltiorrhiza]|uniref:uncharacterized protein LOC130988675 isoform X2 n=1 Tax=Salvia miltiorrhiza TaxID=226208 RepID=UPI0025AC762D|nr:uncharacterized protein LOC130988675 isoform X2 [Salvia miltiorrhiza]